MRYSDYHRVGGWAGGWAAGRRKATTMSESTYHRAKITKCGGRVAHPF